MKKPFPPPQPATLDIAHWGRSADGVAVLEGENIFVPYVLPGERVDVEIMRRHKMPPIAKVKNIVTPSPQRVEAPCQHFGLCGGCALQHANEQAYTDYKVGLIKHELSRAGIEPKAWMPMRISPAGARRRVSYSARRFMDGKLSLGFNERGANWMVDVQRCVVVKPPISDMLAPMRAVLLQLLQPGEKTDVLVTWFPEGLDIVLQGLPRIDWQGRELLAEFARNNGVARLSIRTRKIKDREPVYQVAKPSCTFGTVKVYPPAGAFLQATLEGEAAMVDIVRSAIAEHQPKAKDLADLFAGSGTFSGVLADYGRVLAAEFEGESLDSLTAAKDSRITTRAQDLFSEPLTVAELNVYDVVLFDPPRAGAKEQAAMLAKSKVPLVLAISCNPETFARDAKILMEGGYTFQTLTPVDQFLWSPHLEVVGVFTR